MARMRKIPARKHHGVRDPIKQKEARDKKLENVTNNPPESGNDQKLSYKFAQFKKLADAAKTGRKIKRIHSGKEDKPSSKSSGGKTATGGGSKIRQIKQLYDETDEDYLRRVNRITAESLREAQYEAKYNVNVVHDPKTGAITIKKKPKNEIDELLKQKQKEKRQQRQQKGKGGKNTKAVKPLDAKVAKELIKQAIKEDEEEQKKETLEQREYQRDVIKFGEVVHGPPTLLTLPRKAQKSETVPRPGQKSNLLLKSMLHTTTSTSITNSSTATSKGNMLKSRPAKRMSKPQLQGKRKALPAATRQILEAERDKLVQLYRQLKKTQTKDD